MVQSQTGFGEMMISYGTEKPHPALEEAIRSGAWGVEDNIELVDHWTAQLGGKKVNWQIAFNAAKGAAAVIDVDAGGPILWVQATSIAEAAYEASKR